MTKPYIQILLGTLNGAAWLIPQLRSIERQTGVNWRLLISDDGSTDQTFEILKSFAQSHRPGRVRIVRGPRSGVAANYLHLIRSADPEADYVALADQDDIWFPERLIHAVHKLSNCGSGPRLYASRTWVKPVIGNLFVSKRFPGTPTFRNALAQNILPGNTIVLDKSAVKMVVSAFQPNIDVPFHDWWLYLLMTGCGGKVFLDDAPTLIYRQHSANTVGANSGFGALTKRALSVFSGTYRTWLLKNLAALKENSIALDRNARTAIRDAELFLVDHHAIRTENIPPFHSSFLGNAGFRISCELGRVSMYSKQN